MAEIRIEPDKRGGAARWLVPLLLLALLAALAYWWFVMRAGVPVDGVDDSTNVDTPAVAPTSWRPQPPGGADGLLATAVRRASARPAMRPASLS